MRATSEADQLSRGDNKQPGWPAGLEENITVVNHKLVARHCTAKPGPSARHEAGNASTAGDRRTVYSFSKNRREQVRASISRFNGSPYVDLRVFFEGADGEFHPTRKGLTVAPGLLDELAEAVRRLQAALPDR